MKRKILVLIFMCCLVLSCGEGGRTVGGRDVVRFDMFEAVFPDYGHIDKPDQSEISLDSGIVDKKDPSPDLAGQGCVSVGSLVITEIMADPAASSDKFGEYIEIYNTSSAPVDLRGYVLQSGTAKHQITGPEPVVVEPGAHFLMAANTDPTLNGGISPQYVYSKISLSNTADDISILCNGNIIDRVVYNTSAGWPKKTGGGVAMVLDPSAYDAEKNDQAGNWCRGAEQFGLGDLGSPGQANKPCAPTSCGDKVIQTWEQCDDGNKKANDGCEPDCTFSKDSDADGVFDFQDNCPQIPNQDQSDADQDKVGDACDTAYCGNGVVETPEECDDKNKISGDGCENDCKRSVDNDGDGFFDSVDNCPSVSNPDQKDGDGDGKGDVCDAPECGNAVKEGLEACDDGNVVSGDGCSRLCTIEEYKVGAIIVTEFMYDPTATDDSKGEYLEVYNTTDSPVDIAGWVLDDGAGDSVRLMPEDGTLIVEPKGFLVLGRISDPFLNGGVPVDYAYGSGFTLGNNVDRIRILWNNVPIDIVEYAIGSIFPKSAGHSISLDPAFFDYELNDEGEAWCPTPDDYPLTLGDFGTPGELNPACP